MSDARPTTSTAAAEDAGGAPSPLASERLTRRARVSQAVDRCVAEKKHGDTITRAELESWFNLTYPVNGSRAEYQKLELLFAALKSDFDGEMLTTYRMALASERNGRWRIVLPSEQADLATKTAREAFTRGLAKAGAIAAHVEVAQLNDGERARLDDTAARLASIRMFATSSLRPALPKAKGEKV